MLLAGWEKKTSGMTYFQVKVDVAEMDKVIEAHNRQNPDSKITYTAFVIRMIANIFATRSRINAKISFGSLVPIDQLNIQCLIKVKNKYIGSYLIKNSQALSVQGVNELLKRKIDVIRGSKYKKLNTFMQLVRALPIAMMRAFFECFSFFTYNLNAEAGVAQIYRNHFGTGILSNVVRYNIFDGFAPLVNFTRTIISVALNTPKEVPWVVDGKVEPRKIMNVTLTVDSRFFDVADYKKIHDCIRNVFLNPSQYLLE